MKFEDALRKVIRESEDGQLNISKRANFDYYQISRFIKGEKRLLVSEMQQLFDAFTQADRNKMLELINKGHSSLDINQ